MNSSKFFLAILLIVILIIGYVLRENDVVLNIGDTYYIINFFTIALYILYVFAGVLILRLVYSMLKK